MDTSSKKFQELPAIPEDIMIDILLRLSVKSLLRFKSVCKTWYNLIKTPSFISMHHNFGNVSKLLTCTSDISPKEYVFSFRSNDKSAMVLSSDFEIPGSGHAVYFGGSCNGIVCYFDVSPTIFLSNPATREHKQLPPSSIISDLELWLVGVGFGFGSPNIYDFKVLCVFEEREYAPLNPKLRGEMFTLSSNSWRQIEWGLDDTLHFVDYLGAFCANSFHFLVRLPGASKASIVCCDLNTERFRTMDFPEKEGRRFTSIMVVKEFLSALRAVIEDPRSEKYGIEIWIMKDYEVVESWTKLYRIEPTLRLSQLFCFWMDDRDLLLVRHKYKLVAFNLSTLESIKIDGYQFYSDVVVYKESLVSIM